MNNLNVNNLLSVINQTLDFWAQTKANHSIYQNLRTRANLTQKELAKKCDIKNNSTLCTFERKYKNAHVNIFFAYAYLSKIAPVVIEELPEIILKIKEKFNLPNDIIWVEMGLSSTSFYYSILKNKYSCKVETYIKIITWVKNKLINYEQHL